MNRFYFLALIAAYAFNSFTYAQSIKPGVWKGKVTYKVNGIPLPSSEDEDCILPHEAKDVKASIEKNLKKNGCALTKWRVKKQKLEASLKCKSEDIDASGTIEGVFSKTHYELQGEAEGKYKDLLPASAKIGIKGEWVEACKGEKKG